MTCGTIKFSQNPAISPEFRNIASRRELQNYPISATEIVNGTEVRLMKILSESMGAAPEGCRMNRNLGRLFVSENKRPNVKSGTPPVNSPTFLPHGVPKGTKKGRVT
jgi:hypothetical protein